MVDARGYLETVFGVPLSDYFMDPNGAYIGGELKHAIVSVDLDQTNAQTTFGMIDEPFPAQMVAVICEEYHAASSRPVLITTYDKSRESHVHVCGGPGVRPRVQTVLPAKVQYQNRKFLDVLLPSGSGGSAQPRHWYTVRSSKEVFVDVKMDSIWITRRLRGFRLDECKQGLQVANCPDRNEVHYLLPLGHDENGMAICPLAEVVTYVEETLGSTNERAQLADGTSAILMPYEDVDNLLKNVERVMSKAVAEVMLSDFCLLAASEAPSWNVTLRVHLFYFI